VSRPVYVTGSGSFLPGAPIPFDRIHQVLGELSQAPPRIQRWLKRSHPVMRELLAIRHVHYALDPETRRFTEDNVSMAVKAAHLALERAGLAAGEADLICYGSAHQDQMPTAAVRIQEALGIERCQELSLHANCTSAYKALYLAHQLVAAGLNETALVLSAGISSSELRAEYFNQALVDKESLFLRWFLSDGAGALVLSAQPAAGARLVLEQSFIESIGGKRPSLMFNQRPAYWMDPRQEWAEGRHHLRQRFRNALGSEIFQEQGGSVFFHGLRRMLEQGPVPPERVRYFQVNLPAKHIAESVMEECQALGIAACAYYSSLDELGYCGPPMALIGLDQVLRHERLDPGDRVLSFVTEVSKFMQAGYAVRCDAGS